MGHKLFFPDLFHLLHELNKVEDDVLSEEDFDFLEAEVIVEKHVPANGSSGPIDHSQPLNCFDLKLIYLGLLSYLEYVRDPELHLDLPPVTVGQNLSQNTIVVLLLKSIGTTLMSF